MDVHSPDSTGKKLWNFLRVAFFMMRKGLVSKRKLIMDMNLFMKRGKLMGKTLGNHLMMFHHHHHHHHSKSVSPAHGLRHYEFSCSNSPNPVFFHSKRRRHNYFPCINLSSVAEEEPDESPAPPAVVLPRIEYSPSPQIFCNSCDLALGEHRSQMPSPFSVRVSNYSEVEEGDGSGGQEVDSEAEEFIKRFYEQLRAQSRIALLQYQEMEYQQMLARGT